MITLNRPLTLLKPVKNYNKILAVILLNQAIAMLRLMLLLSGKIQQSFIDSWVAQKTVKRNMIYCCPVSERSQMFNPVREGFQTCVCIRYVRMEEKWNFMHGQTLCRY